MGTKLRASRFIGIPQMKFWNFLTIFGNFLWHIFPLSQIVRGEEKSVKIFRTKKIKNSEWNSGIIHYTVLHDDIWITITVSPSLIYRTHGNVRNARHSRNSLAEQSPDAGRKRNPVWEWRNRDTSPTSGIWSRLIKPLKKWFKFAE